MTKNIRIIIFDDERKSIRDIYELSESQLFTPKGNLRSHPIHLLTTAIRGMLEKKTPINLDYVEYMDKEGKNEN